MVIYHPLQGHSLPSPSAHCLSWEPGPAQKTNPTTLPYHQPPALPVGLQTDPRFLNFTAGSSINFSLALSSSTPYTHAHAHTHTHTHQTGFLLSTFCTITCKLFVQIYTHKANTYHGKLVISFIKEK